jgi:hypothetical protein
MSNKLLKLLFIQIMLNFNSVYFQLKVKNCEKKTISFSLYYKVDFFSVI